MLSALPTAGGMIYTTDMEKRGRLLVHSTRDDSYIVVVKPAEWIVAISNEAVMGYDANLVDLEFEGQRTNCRVLLARGVSPLLVEQWKAQSLPIFKEMQVLRNLAQSHRVAHKDVRVTVVRSPRSYAMELIGQEENRERKEEEEEAAATDLLSFSPPSSPSRPSATKDEPRRADLSSSSSSTATPPAAVLVKNSAASDLASGDLEEFSRSRCITGVMQSDVWGREYQAYRQWFQRTYFA